jgi:formylglycine-generating enzyme required for sulfatase activity
MFPSPTMIPIAAIVLLLGGFVPGQDAQPSSPRFIRGDASNDNVLSVTDSLLILRHLFQGEEGLTCEDAADADDSGVLDVTDGVYILLRLFAGGRPPPAPYPGCGTDPTEDGLGCLDYNGCAPLPEFRNSLGMSFVLIQPGTYMRGSPEDERGRDLSWWETGPRRTPDEDLHRVRITCAFYMSATEVTQGQYQAVMGWDPSQGGRHPDRAVNWVTWQEAVEFCSILTKMERLEAPLKYRLPTEAEWEYACRAGTTTRYWFGNALECNDYGDPPCPLFNQFMWYSGHPQAVTMLPNAVGIKPANPWGLHDMHGGVGEWCQDWYAPYPTDRTDPIRDELIDPSGPRHGTMKIVRGWAINNPHLGRSAARGYASLTSRGGNTGFRVVLGGCPAPPPTVP